MAGVAAGADQQEADAERVPDRPIPRFWTCRLDLEAHAPSTGLFAEVVTAPAARSGRAPRSGGVVPAGMLMFTAVPSVPGTPVREWG